MSGFVPVPRDALNAVEPSEWGAVTDIYQRAHALRWQPFRVTERSLCTRWSLGNRRVWTLLRDLEALGLLTLTRGKKRQASVVEVACPTSERQQIAGVRQGGQQAGQQCGQHNSPVSSQAMADTAAQGAAQGAAVGAALLTRPETKPETETKKKPSELDTVFASYAAHHKAKSGRTRKAIPKGMGQRIDDHGAEAALLVLAWAFDSDDDRPQLLRKGNHLTDTLWRPANFESYLDMASEWDARGRTTEGGGRTPDQELGLLQQMQRIQNDPDYMYAPRGAERHALIDAKATEIGWPTMRADLKSRGTGFSVMLGLSDYALKNLTKGTRQ